MLLDEKPLSDLTLADIEQLVSAPVCESQRLEYKRDWWGASDEGKREMLRDIAALANAFGGHIILGVETRRAQGGGDLECPTAIVGLPRQNYTERILASCRDNLDPPCPGIEAQQIEYGPERAVLVVHIPQSLDAPHMVTLKGLNQFWRRQATSKQPMVTQEIRGLFLERLSYQDRLLRFVADQKQKVRRGIPSNNPTLWIWAAPIIPLSADIDIRDQDLKRLLSESTRQDPYGQNCEIYSGMSEPTLYGLRAEERGDPQSLELHRTGFTHLTTARFNSTEANREIIASRVATYLENLGQFSSALFAHLRIEGPLALGCVLFNVNGHRLQLGNRRFSPRQWDETHLELDHRLGTSADIVSITRSMNDRLWNAFGLEECPYYTTGKLVIPRS